MPCYSIVPTARKYVKKSVHLPFARNSSDKYREILLDTPRKSGVDVAKTVFKKIFHS